MAIFGLTGGIATGKSTVSAQLRALGWPVIDADQIAREIVEPGSPTLEQIKLAFGPRAVQQGSLDRTFLGQLIFDQPAARQQLDRIMAEPLERAITAKIAFWETQNVPGVIFDAPLLFEHKYHQRDLLSAIIVVTVDENTQLDRLQARDGVTIFAAQQRLAAQLPLADKVAQADFVITNTGSLAATAEQVTRLDAQLRAFVGTKNGKK